MLDNATVLILWGGMLLAGYAAHVVGEKTRVPRVTLLLLLGVIGGPELLELVPAQASAWFPTVAQLALAMVGFLLGEEFMASASQHSKQVLGFALAVTLATAVVVVGAVLLAGGSLALALVLGGVATATDPAATLDLIHETKARGPMTQIVRGTVALDDVLGVLIFSVGLAVAEVVEGSGNPGSELLRAAWEVGAAVVLGALAGLPMAWLTGRLRRGQPAALEALGFVLLVAGVAEHLQVSFLLASMTLGATVAVRAKHHKRAVHEIEGFSAPLLALFFLLAGMQLRFDALVSLGVLGGAYVLARVVGRMVGGEIWGLAVRKQQLSRRASFCLLPQAGVAIGLALVAVERLPQVGAAALPIAVGATVVFEIFGPIAARVALTRAGEVSQGDTH